jgi:hypothetical protein
MPPKNLKASGRGHQSRKRKKPSPPAPTTKKKQKTAAPRMDSQEPCSNGQLAGRKRDRENLLHEANQKRVQRMFSVMDEEFMKAVCFQAGLGSEQPWEIPIEDLCNKGRSNSQWISIFDRLNKFCALIGDHRSRIILMRRAPKNCPPQNPRTLILFMRHHVYAGPIMDIDETPLRALDGSIIEGKGSWKKFPCLKQFSSSISTLHRSRGYNVESWREACQACINEEKNSANGCWRHTGGKLIEEIGNPIYSEAFDVEFRTLSKLVSHEKESSKGLNPFQLETMVNYFLMEVVDNASKGDLDKAKFFVSVISMLLLSVSLFLRDDDLKDIQVVDFRPQDSIILENGDIDAIAGSFSGKGEDNKQTRLSLVIWRNRVSLLLDPIFWLMLHLCVFSIDDGYIFRHQSESAYAKEIKKALLLLFPDQDWSETCTHVGKKSAYIIARLGEGEIDLIAQAGRNRTE